MSELALPETEIARRAAEKSPKAVVVPDWHPVEKDYVARVCPHTSGVYGAVFPDVSRAGTLTGKVAGQSLGTVYQRCHRMCQAFRPDEHDQPAKPESIGADGVAIPAQERGQASGHCGYEEDGRQTVSLLRQLVGALQILGAGPASAFDVDPAAK
jgi:hypothetical protein